jgi:hypothetical protein
MTERSLIIDGTNIFYRAYVVNPSLSNSGLPVGGLVGFLKSLQKLIREMKPTKVGMGQAGLHDEGPLCPHTKKAERQLG